MRHSRRAATYICLPCQGRTGRLFGVTNSLKPPSNSRRSFSGRTSLLQNADQASLAEDVKDYPPQDVSKINTAAFHNENTHHTRRERRSTAERSRGKVAEPLKRLQSTSESPLELSDAQRQKLKGYHDISLRLSQGLSRVPAIKTDPTVMDGLKFEDIYKAIPSDGQPAEQQKLLQQLEAGYRGELYSTVKTHLDLATPHRNPAQRFVTLPSTRAALGRLGVVEGANDYPAQPKLESPPKVSSSNTSSVKTKFDKPTGNVLSRTDKDSVQSKSRSQPAVEPGSADTVKPKRHKPLASMVAAAIPAPKKAATKIPVRPVPTKPLKYTIKKPNWQTIEAKELTITSIDAQSKAVLPQLSFDLTRVLFNPGIYYLQDPRSRVYNFDPYLEQIMPVSEFNFDALTPYQTSSEDRQLLELARKYEKRYIGSSSSMTSALSHFHFLLSYFRELTVEHLTRGFRETARTFTLLTRAPAAIFLRYRDGVYAVDADKEYDEPNILMSLGKSMEKLLTLEKDEFERWRKSNAQPNAPQIGDMPEAFHYSGQGRFLLRSQLDVFDPRLPGRGYFDLKTRAAVGIRMNVKETDAGAGYEIIQRFGTWESFEREYYDMMRSTFLKYSLQARMGQMDGIFVAYHNIKRMFGFQYIPISEMDRALHGQEDPCLGDQEFKFSIHLMEEIFNMATEAFPRESLRIHFESREGSPGNPKPSMNIFIEPMSEDAIKAIQESQKAQHEAFERSMLRGEEPEAVSDLEENRVSNVKVEEQPQIDADKVSENIPTEATEAPLPVDTTISRPIGPATNAANKDFLDRIMNSPQFENPPEFVEKKIMALKLTIQNKINGSMINRPEKIKSGAAWTLDYEIEKISGDEAKRLYRFCKSRRMSTLKAAMNRGVDNYYMRSIREMSRKGAARRKQQDELDSQREQVVLYDSRATG